MKLSQTVDIISMKLGSKMSSAKYPFGLNDLIRIKIRESYISTTKIVTITKDLAVVNLFFEFNLT